MPLNDNTSSDKAQSLADILGPWKDPNFDSGLIERCRNAWDKPLRELARGELAMLLRQKIAVAHLIPVAQDKLRASTGDETELFDGELEEELNKAKSTS